MARLEKLSDRDFEVFRLFGEGKRGQGANSSRPPHSPTPVRVLTVHGAAGAKAIS
jgi:hypothetical protein